MFNVAALHKITEVPWPCKPGRNFNYELHTIVDSRAEGEITQPENCIMKIVL